MALTISPRITLNTNCQSFVLVDLTGSYDVTSNPGGWGTPNPETTDLSAVSLTITDNQNINSTTYNVPAADVASILSSGLTITADDIYGTTSFTDGAYTIVVTYTVDGTDYESTIYKGWFCQAICCVRSMGAGLNIKSCDSKDIATWNFAMNLLASAYWATCCGKYDEYQTIIDYVNELCDGCGGSTNTSTSSSSGCGCS